MPSGAMSSICLCMIVRNEAAVIERCLESVGPLIDTWVICDTGSIDETRELIRKALADVPGELHERPWVDFGHNRTELMALALGKADYLLLIDADMTVSFDKARVRHLDASSYMLRHAEDPEYWVKRLVRADRRWRYVGVTHEYITTDGDDQARNLHAIVIHHHGDSGTRTEKFERDLRLLTDELERHPSDARTVFYLAQTLRDLGRIEESIDYYRRRSGMGGWEEEVFYSLYQLGVLTERAGRRDQAIATLFEAWDRRPQRIEPLYELSWMFRERGLHHAAYMVTQRGIDAPVPPDTLFVHRWVYDWGLLFEYSIAAYWAGRPRAALDACDRLLKVPQLPDAYREQVIANRGYCLHAAGDALAASVTPTRRRSRGSRHR
jgi:glycosyltransferase involved in cell wall biosynthesis